MITITLRRGEPPTLREQISLQLKSAIEARELEMGMYLPSTRSLARMLRVSRNTALAAYDDVVAEGLIAGVPGGGMRVLSRPQDVPLAVVGMRSVLGAAHFPGRTYMYSDPDGNPLYFNY